MSNGLELLSRDGWCCALRVSYPRFRYKINPAVLGFNMKSDKAKALIQGSSSPLLARAMKRITTLESQARDAVNSRTFELDKGVGLRFCPFGSFAQLCTEIEQKVTEFEEAVAEFIADFPKHIVQLRQDILEVYQLEHKLSAEQLDNVKNFLLRKIPTTPPMPQQFSMTLIWREVTVPDKPSLTGLALEDAETIQRLASEHRERALNEVRDMTRNFAQDCRAELCSRMESFLEDISGTIRRGKTVNRRTLRRINEFMAQINDLNFMQDAGIEQTLQGFRNICGNLDTGLKKGDRRISELVGQVSSSLLQVRTELTTITEQAEARLADDAVLQRRTLNLSGPSEDSEEDDTEDDLDETEEAEEPASAEEQDAALPAPITIPFNPPPRETHMTFPLRMTF